MLPLKGMFNLDLADRPAAHRLVPVRGDAGYGSNWPCPGAQSTAFHTANEADTKGCALAIAYNSDPKSIQPEDFVVFSVNHTCVWSLNTAFDIPQLPACPEGGCHCSWNWIHSVSVCA